MVEIVYTPRKVVDAYREEVCGGVVALQKPVDSILFIGREPLVKIYHLPDHLHNHRLARHTLWDACQTEHGHEHLELIRSAALEEKQPM